MRYPDRRAAGEQLAREVAGLALEDVVVLGLPRGGVPVAAPIARWLGAPLDVLVVRKLGVPWQPELGMGAIAEGGVLLVNEQVLRQARLSKEQFEAVVAEETEELERRAERYRGGRPPRDLGGKTVVIVDDGLATGFTARAAVEAARRLGAARVIVAVPVGAPSSVVELASVADHVVCPQQPAGFGAVGAWYVDFAQVSDGEVAALL